MIRLLIYNLKSDLFWRLKYIPAQIKIKIKYTLVVVGTIRGGYYTLPLRERPPPMLVLCLHVWLSVRLDSFDVEALNDVRGAVDGDIPIDMNLSNLKGSLKAFVEHA